MQVLERMQGILESRFRWLGVFASIFVTCFIVYFLYCDRFGTYSDDQYFIAVYLLGQARNALVHDALWMGRPLGFLAFSLLYPLYAVGGLPLAYLGSCLALSIETLLVFLFFRIFIADVASLALAFVYLLFPPDVAKFMFVHALFSHLSGIMFWCAAILYARRMAAMSAVVAVATILVYETHVVQAVFIPVICYVLRRLSSGTADNWRQELRAATKFLCVFALAGGLLLIGRVSFAPGRLPTSPPTGLLETVAKFVGAGVYGLRAVLRSHVDRLNSLASSSSVYTYVILSFLILFNIWLLGVSRDRYLTSEAGYINRTWAGICILIALVIMDVSYVPFALEPARFPPVQITTRGSGVHYGAAVGYALVWAGFFGVLANWKQARVVVFSLSFILYSLVMAGFFILHQERLVENWRTQEIYWREMEECLRAANPKLIIVDNPEEEARAGASQAEALFSWPTPYVPYLMKHSIRQAAKWPLVQSLWSFKNEAKVANEHVRLSV